MQHVEQWRPFPGYEGIYEVSDLGRVRSKDRVVRGRNGFPRPIRGKLMTPCVGGGGYLHVSVRRPVDGLRSVVVHRAVLIAFVGLPPSGHEACHGPRGRLVNELTNLRWGTRLENVADKAEFGRTVEGEKNAQAKLTEVQVREILASTGRLVDLARVYGVSPELIGAIRKGRAWRHIERPNAYAAERGLTLHAPKSWGEYA